MRWLHFVVVQSVFVFVGQTLATGYHVDWAAIPRAITPLNRILVAVGRCKLNFDP
jgi:hypothetical protein